MALFEDVFKGGNIISGLAIGVALYVLAPVIVPVLRPVAKSMLRAGLMAYDEARAALAELGEKTEDMMAEVRSEKAPKPNGGGPPQKTATATEQP